MRECIVLFGFDQIRQRKLAARLLPARFRVRVVKEEELDLPVGFLAGIEELAPDRTETEEIAAEKAKGSHGAEAMTAGKAEEADEAEQKSSTVVLDAPMILMAGVTSDRLDQVIRAVKQSGIGPVPYKAVLTETNQSWKAAELLEELKKEHEAMTGGSTPAHLPKV